jgi:hypothetical protein
VRTSNLTIQRAIYNTARYVVYMIDTRSACKILIRRLERKRSLGRRRCRWKEEIGCGFDWIRMPRDVQWRALANTVMKLRVPKGGIFLGRLNDC